MSNHDDDLFETGNAANEVGELFDKGALGLLHSGDIELHPDELRSMLDVAYNNSDRLEVLINDILDIEKIESGTLDYHMESMGVVSLLEEAIEANKGFADEHGVTFVQAATEKETFVRGDKDRLMQVLSNLMSNAAKFSSDGGLVEMSIAGDGENVRIAVKDSGRGVPDEFRESIFEKFSQADSSDTRQKGGTGLGLSIAKAIVEHHDGEIGFDSEVGIGSTFFFLLPVSKEPVPGHEQRFGRPRVNQTSA